MDERTDHDRNRATLVRAIVEGDRDLSEAAATLRVDLSELAGLADERVLRTLELLRHLSLLRNEQFLERFRVSAIVRLIELARQREDPELSRKACVDLLRTDLSKPLESRGRLGEAADAGGPIDTEAVLAMLAEIGCR